MVNLPSEDNQYQFLEEVYLHRMRSRLQKSAVKLTDVERFGSWAAKCMVPATHESYQKYRQAAINRIRQSINMEFKMCCHICRKPHQQDEITAPER